MQKNKFLKIAFRAILLSIVLLPLATQSAFAKINYDEVRALTSRDCHPLCNLKQYESETDYDPYSLSNYYYGNYGLQNYGNYGYYPYTNAYYTPEVNLNNPYGYPQQNYGYNQQPPVQYQYNPQTGQYVPVPVANFGQQTQPPVTQAAQQQTYYNYGQQVASNQTPQYTNQYQQFVPTANAQGNYVQQQGGQYISPSHLSSSGGETYLIMGAVIMLASGIVYFIRKKRKMLRAAF